jgi:uroporphyrinogen-III decarboxylase
MNHRERFKAVVRFEKPDYIPLFGNFGAPGFSMGAQRIGYEKLVREGMPPRVGGMFTGTGFDRLETWQRYWGVTSALRLDFFPADKGGPGIGHTKRIENGYEVLEYESGAIVRQVVNNDDEYSMPEFVRDHVRDRASWELYRERMAPGPLWSMERIREACRPYEDRTRPLAIACGSTWGHLRDLVGAERAATILYDDPELAHEIIDDYCGRFRTYVFPLIELLRPEIVTTGEDICYNKGMIISPRHFREFCAPYYRETADLCRSAGVDLLEVDSDGNAMELVPELVSCGFNGLYPFECKAGNDLFALRKAFPRFILMGWLEKEAVNDGNEGMIENEILSKVPALLKTGGYLPNGDHGIQPYIGFRSLCRFMTLLHDVTGNPEGEFPRM